MTDTTPRGKSTTVAMKHVTGAYGQGLHANGFTYRHVHSCVLNRGGGPEPEEVLGRGLQNDIDEQDPGPGLDSGDASIVYVGDLEQLGNVLKDLFGAPVTTGAGVDKSHAFTSGTALPDVQIEQKLAAAVFQNGLGLVAKRGVLTGGSEKGFLRAQVDYLARAISANYAASTIGAPTAQALSSRVPKAIGQLYFDAARPGRILDWTLTLEPQLETDTLDGDTAEVGAVTVVGYKAKLDVTARFATGVLAAKGDAAANALPAIVAVKLLWQVSPTLLLQIDLPAVRFKPVPIPVPGGGKITLKMEGNAEATTLLPMVTATLKNQIATYA